MTRNHPELVQTLEIFIYSENTGFYLSKGQQSEWSTTINNKNPSQLAPQVKKLFPTRPPCEVW
jgi:hypothetical protein